MKNHLVNTTSVKMTVQLKIQLLRNRRNKAKKMMSVILKSDDMKSTRNMSEKSVENINNSKYKL